MLQPMQHQFARGMMSESMAVYCALLKSLISSTLSYHFLYDDTSQYLPKTVLYCLQFTCFIIECVDSFFFCRKICQLLSSCNRQKPIQFGRTTNVSSASPRTMCSLSALKRLLTVVRGHFGRKTRTASITNLPKTVPYFCKRTVLKVLCYQNMYAEKHPYAQETIIANKGHTNIKRQFRVIK